MPIICMKPRKSNWETVAFVLIYQITGLTSKTFTRNQLMSSQNMEMALDCLVQLKHKKDPERPEASLQKAIQNLRDKGFVKFHGEGDYELTKMGINERNRIFLEMKIASPEDFYKYVKNTKHEHDEIVLEKAANLFENLSKDQIKSVLEKASETKT